jgi:hypothetical protein
MPADQARKAIMAAQTLCAIETLGAVHQQRVPRSADQAVLAYRQRAKRAHDAKCNQHG